jgi:hypothetical protein
VAFGIWHLVPGIWYLVLGVGCWVFGTWCLVFSAWCLVLGAWYLVLGAWCLVFGFVLDVQVLTWVLTFRGITTAEEVNILGWPAMDGGTRER